MSKTKRFQKVKACRSLLPLRSLAIGFCLPALLLIAMPLKSQEGLEPKEWKVPPKAKKKISYQKFTKDRQDEGRMLYERACQSCHGRPTKDEPALMAPSPGDPATKRFRKQKDGELFYKIKTGRELMPSFKDSLSRDEIWNIIAYIRSYHDGYEQPMPDLTGVFVPEFKVDLDFDENIDKFIVKVNITNKKENQNNQGVEVLAYVKSMFGKYSLGTKKTDSRGLAFFDVPADLPGDDKGNMIALAKVRQGYGFAKKEKTMKMGKPQKAQSVTDGRHLWSAQGEAPIWLRLVFWGSLLAIWSIIIWTFFSLRKIKSYA